MRPEDPDGLTRRETEVRELMDRGLTNQEIAGRLGISVPGVKYHVSQILSKLGIGSRREVGAGRKWGGIAWRAGLGVGAAAAVVALAALAVGLLLADEGEGESVVAWDGPVYIESISPPSGTIGTTVEIRGYGFTLGGNDVGFTAEAVGDSPRFGETAYQWDVPSPDGKTIRLALPDTLGACPISQSGGCVTVGLHLPTGELNVAVYNRNGISNRVPFRREISRLEVAEEAIYESPDFQMMTDSLDPLVAASFQPSTGLHLVSYSIGIYESDEGEVYIELGIHGIDASDLPIIPDELAGYEVRLAQTPD